MIEGVKVKKLEGRPDERGHLMEILRSDDEFFERFGQSYLTTVFPGSIKAWKMHDRQDDNMACVKGMVRLALYDAREGSPTRGEVAELFLGEHNPLLVHIPRGVYHGIKCVSEDEAFVIDHPTELYNPENPDEHRLPPDTDEIPHDWSVTMG